MVRAGVGEGGGGGRSLTNRMCLSETEPPQVAPLVLTKLVFFERERFQRTTRKIAARSDETLGDVTGNLDDQVHVFSSLHIDMNAMKNQTTDSRPGGRIPCPHG